MPYVFVELSSTCGQCGAAIEPRLLATEFTCEKCGRRQSWHPRTWAWLLSHAGAAAEWPLGAQRTFSMRAGGRDAWVRMGKDGAVGPFAAAITVGRAEVACPACGAALDPKEPGGACPGCKTKIRVRDSARNTPWVPQFVSRSIGEDLARRFWLWIDENALARERLIEARWKVTAVGCATSLLLLAALFALVWWRIAFAAAWQAALLLVPVLFVLNTAARLATPLFLRRKKRGEPRP